MQKILISPLVFVFLYFSLFGYMPAKATHTPASRRQAIASRGGPALPAHKSGELLVKLKNSLQIYKFKFSPENSGENLKELIEFYHSQPQIEYVEPNYVYQAALEPLDTYYTQQIYLTQIKANLAWNTTTGGSKITIAVIDSGVDIDHPDLESNIWTNTQEIANNGLDDDNNGYVDDVNGWDFIKDNNNPKPKFDEGYTVTGINHGTVVAGIAAARGGNEQGIAGVSWRAKIMPLRVLDGAGIGDTLTVAQAVDYARENGVDIINLSFVGEGKSLTLEKAIQKASEAGVLVIAAAGNEIKQGVNLNKSPQYPVCHDGPNGENWVLGIASVDKNDRLASFSNYGTSCVDLVAPGVSLFSTLYHNDYNQEFEKYYGGGWTGTSVSVPQVAGAIALIKSMNSDLSISQIQNLLFDHADNINSQNRNYSGLLGHGRLNVYSALSHSLEKKAEIPVKIVKMISSPAKNGGPHVRVFKKTIVNNQFFADDEKLRSNLSAASGDLDNDGQSEIIVGLGQGTYPKVKIFSMDGKLKQEIMAYAQSFRGGVEVALGDLDGDDQLEIITAAGQGGGPHVRIFDSLGNLKGQFFAFENSNRAGLEIATGDINNDGKDEIVVAKKSGLPEVKIFNAQGNLIKSFLAYAPNFHGGVHLAVGDLDNDKRDEIVTGAGFSGGPHVRIFDSAGNLKGQFFSYASYFRGGTYVAVGDVDGDGQTEIITGAGPTGGPHVRVFTMDGGVKMQFFAYDEKFRGGVRVATER